MDSIVLPPSEVIEEIKRASPIKCQLYKRRWLILFLFCLLSFFSTLNWIQYCVIADISVQYYSVSYEAVDWSSLVFPTFYVIFSTLGTYLLDKLGLRIPILIGAIGTCAGTWIKVLGVHPDNYWVIMVGQCVVSICQVVILPVPAKLAAVWFGSKEISLASTISAVFIQLGFAVGFIIPPLLVNHGDRETIEKGFYIMSYGYAIIMSLLVALIYFFYVDAPPNPPTQAQLQVEENKQKLFDYKKSLRNNLKNKSFVIFVLMYGMHFGASVALPVLLNQLILSHYPNASTEVGVIGLLMTASGIFGPTIYGMFLSKYCQLKLVTWVTYISSTVTSMLFVFLIDQGLIVVYVLAIVASVFWNCIFCIGFEIGMELTYPEPEAASSGMLINSYQILAVALTYILSYFYKNVSELAGNLCLTVILLLADALLLFIKFDLKRSTVDEVKSDPNYIL